MNMFALIMLIIFSPMLLILSLMLLMTINVAAVSGFVYIMEWIGNLFRRVKSFRHPTEVSKDTLQLEPDDIFRRHEEAYVASLKNTNKGNDK